MTIERPDPNDPYSWMRDLLFSKWYAHPNDLIGGWSIMSVDSPPSQTKYNEVACFTDELLARHMVRLHNEYLRVNGQPEEGNDGKS